MKDVEPPESVEPPSGVVGPRGFTETSEVVDALLALVRSAVEPAIERREARALITGRGDIASTLVLDAERARALLAQRPAEPIDQSALSRRRRSLQVRLEATDPNGPPLARGLIRWQLDGDEILLLGAAFAAAVDPVLSRLLVYLGGDPARPHLSVEAAAALAGDGVDAVLFIGRMLARHSRLARLGLIGLGRADMPLLRRSVEIAPRVLELAAGVIECSRPRLELVDPDRPAGASLADADVAVLRSVATRRDGRLAWVLGRRGVEHDLARALSIDGVALLAAGVDALDPETEPALLREAALANAALAVGTWNRRLSPAEETRLAATLDRLAPSVPIFLLGDAPMELPLAARQVIASARSTRSSEVVSGWEREFPARAVSTARASLASWARAPDRAHIALVCGDVGPAMTFVKELTAEARRSLRRLDQAPETPPGPGEILVISSQKLDFGGRFELERLINRLIALSATAFVIYAGPLSPSLPQLVDVVLELRSRDGDRLMREAFNLDIV